MPTRCMNTLQAVQGEGSTTRLSDKWSDRWRAGQPPTGLLFSLPTITQTCLLCSSTCTVIPQARSLGCSAHTYRQTESTFDDDPPAVTTKSTLTAGGSVAVVPPGGSAAILLKRPGALLQGGWHDLTGQVQVHTQVLDALVCEEPVVVPPGKELSHQLT